MRIYLKMMKINFMLYFFNFYIRNYKLEAWKSEAPFKIVWLFKIFAVDKSFCKKITRCKSDALQKCCHTEVTSYNNGHRAKVSTCKNIALQKFPLLQKNHLEKVSLRAKMTLVQKSRRAKVNLRAKESYWQSVPLCKRVTVKKCLCAKVTPTQLNLF